MNQFLKEIDALMKQDKERQVIAQIESSPDMIDKDVLKSLGCAYIRVGACDKALRSFEMFFQFPHEKHEAAFVWVNMATIMRIQGQPMKGVAITGRLIKDYPENPVYWTEMGNCYAGAGKDCEAERCFMKALEYLENEDQYNKAAIYSFIGYYYKEKEEYKTAIHYLKLSLSFHPTDKTVILHLGDAYSEDGQNKEAKEAYVKAKNYFPEDAHTQDYVRIRLGYLDEDG
jgi:tetratricopeptide (TPR) repeat protein